MGCPYPKPHHGPRTDKTRGIESLKQPTKSEFNDSCVSDAELMRRGDQETINSIKKDLYETPDIFVLNNVLMSTMFLRNYQEEIHEAYQSVEKSQDNFWEPDIVMERANRHVVYRPMHGPRKGVAEPLVTRRIYVPLNEYIDVYSPLDDDESTKNNVVNKYQVKTEESRRQGFVKLQRVNKDNSNDGSSLKDLLSIPSSTVSGSSDTDSIGTSTGTTFQENRQLIKDQVEEGTLEDCFVFRKVKKPDADMLLEEIDQDLTDEDVYDIISYLPSRKFMKYFQCRIFKNIIAEQLGLVQYEIDQAVVDEHIPGKIFCNLIDDNDNSYPVEVLPCLKASWPNKQTYEFLEKKLLFGSEQKGSVGWPTKRMLQKLKGLQCALVPKGYSRKRGVYPEGDLEWEIHFPLAESYLETFLRPEQIKCYLVLLSIYKEYVEPFTKSHGVVPEHLLTLLLWQSEIDYHGWPEHRLGIRLLNIIENFTDMLSQRSLRHYFIRKRNVFRNVSRKYLDFANERFHTIKQSPLMFIIRALRNLRYTNGSFYPPLNYKELLNIVYKKDWDINPYLSDIGLSYQSSDSISMTSKFERKPKVTDAERQLRLQKEKERRLKMLKKREETNHSKNYSNLSNIYKVVERRESVDSINDVWECERVFHPQKKITLLKFFISNYIDIAQTSFKIGSEQQTRFFLKQAWYLAKILKDETQLFPNESAGFFAKIKEEESKIKTVYKNLDVMKDSNVRGENVSEKTTFNTSDNIHQIEIIVDNDQEVSHKKINSEPLSTYMSIYSEPVMTGDVR